MSATPEQIAIDEKALEAGAESMWAMAYPNWTQGFERNKPQYLIYARAAITAYLSATSDAQAEREKVLAFALEEIKSDAAHVIDFYNRNGPTWTGKDGHEYDDMSSVLSRAETVVQIADAALKAAP